MKITALNERLLRAIGQGIALADADTLEIGFINSAFGDWFGVPEPRQTLVDVFPDIDIAEMRAALDQGQNFQTEVTIKPKRRTLVIAITISIAPSERLIVVECQNITRIRELEAMIESYSKMVERNTRELQREKERVERLLLNVMPKSAYEEFKTFGVVTPQLYNEVSVVMLDLVGFTKFAANNDPTITLGELNDIFTAFDRISEQFGCERIKTIGDAYLGVAGMPLPNPDHARSIANCAVRFVRYLERRNQSHTYRWQARIGIASGAAVGSVVGIQKYVYDVFGPAVNLASRLQTLAPPMTIVADGDMRHALVEEFQLSDLGMSEVRGYGERRLISLSTDLERQNL